MLALVFVLAFRFCFVFSFFCLQDTFRPYGLRDGVIKPTYGMAEHTVFVCSGGEQKITVQRHALEVDKQVQQ